MLLICSLSSVRVSYVDHMNDDMPEVDSFSIVIRLSPPSILRKKPGNEARRRNEEEEEEEKRRRRREEKLSYDQISCLCIFEVIVHQRNMKIRLQCSIKKAFTICVY